MADVRSGSILALALVSLALLLGLVAVAMSLGGRSHPTGSEDGPEASELYVWCAAGIKRPMQELATLYERSYGTRIQLDFGGSGELLGRLEVAGKGDLYLAGDVSYIDRARGKGLVAEGVSLARMAPVLAVAQGNPKGIQGLDDLLRDDVRVAVANPEAAAVGKMTRKLLEQTGHWQRLEPRLTVTKPTVNALADDLKLGAVDATVIWDATAATYGEFDLVPIDAFAQAEKSVTIGVLQSSDQPTRALHFSRYLASREVGNPTFRKHGFRAEGGDAWADVPELLLYSGSVNRPAIEQALREFSEREGVKVETVYNGCGILCSTMQAVSDQGGKLPDAYYACDVCFVPPVAKYFPEATMLTETDIVIAVPAGNPAGIHSLADLARDGLRLGICNAEQSTLGFMTHRMLGQLNIAKAIEPNIKSSVPTGDTLVTQLRTGSLDAVVVYSTNLQGLDEHVEAIAIDHAGAKAIQPYSVRVNSDHQALANRLLDHLRARQDRFEAVGFRFLGDDRPVPASTWESISAPGQFFNE